MICRYCNTRYQNAVNCPSCGASSGQADLEPHEKRAARQPQINAPPPKATKASPAAKRKRNPVAATIIAVLVFIFIISALIISYLENHPQKRNSANGEETSVVELDAALPRHSLGQTALLQGMDVTLLSAEEVVGERYWAAEEGYTYLVCEFELQNNSQSDIHVSSSHFFLVLNGREYAYSYDAMSAEGKKKARLEGTIAPGKKMKGYVGFELPEDWQSGELKITDWEYGSTEYIIFSVDRPN